MIQTSGTNPFFQTEEEIEQEITGHLLPQLRDGSADALYFYGAGCAFPEKIMLIERILRRHIRISDEVRVWSDIAAAARALCGRSEGIACIMGTGSNSCLYDGREIISNVSPLGFILGDEGSGAVLGKLLIGNLLKGQMSGNIKKAFFEETGLTPQHIIESVYKRPFPNRFLASFSPFILRHIENEEIKSMVTESFRSFFRRNVAQYDRSDLPVHFVGSVAYYYESLLREAAEKEGFQVGKILKSPMEGLISYHQ